MTYSKLVLIPNLSGNPNMFTPQYNGNAMSAIISPDGKWVLAKIFRRVDDFKDIENDPQCKILTVLELKSNLTKWDKLEKFTSLNTNFEIK